MNNIQNNPNYFNQNNMNNNINFSAYGNLDMNNIQNNVNQMNNNIAYNNSFQALPNTNSLTNNV